uniref:Uncharacterized protein n=1 Tax=Aegilops tauschii subsp. strangulata TaxID=200361 RepID=A0A452XZ67_AEGTS
MRISDFYPESLVKSDAKLDSKSDCPTWLLLTEVLPLQVLF